MKILIDANIALDVLLERQVFYRSGTKVLGLSKAGINLYISASTITDIYYIIRKERKGKEIAVALTRSLLTTVDIAAVSGSEIYRAIDLGWNDFEDAVLFAVGEKLKVDYIVTRNGSDFSASSIPVKTPEEILTLFTVKNS